MSDGDYLLRAILDDPEDDTVRLAYADWLDENDRPIRASYIRLSIEKSRAVRWEDKHKLHLQLCELEGDHGRQTVLGYAEEWEGWSFTVDRGFISELRMWIWTFERNRSMIFRCQPITKVHIANRTPFTWPRTWTPAKYGGMAFWDTHDYSAPGSSHYLPRYVAEYLVCDPTCLGVYAEDIFFADHRKAKDAANRAFAAHGRSLEREAR